jgi:hypothetical protein
MKSRFLINVTAKIISSYYIMAKRKNTGKVIYEGVPAALVLMSNTPSSVELTNIHENGTITLLVEDLKYLANQGKGSITFQSSLGNDTNIIKSVVTSEGNSNIQLFAKKGTYHINITSDLTTAIIILFTKN